MTITEEPRAGTATAAARPVAPVAAPAGGDEVVGARRASRAPWSTLAVFLVALSPFVVGAVQILRRGFPPGALFGDRAILALTAGDAFRAPVLLGPYSRFYWHHPGPLYFYVLDAWSHVFGQGTVSLVLGATAVNVLGAIGLLYLAHRRGGRPLLVWTAILLSAYLVALDPIPFDIWNPSVTLLPLVALLLLAWSVTCRDWWAIPWLAVVASFVVQTHVGLAPPAMAAIGWCVAVTWWQLRRAPAPLSARERRTLGRASLTGVALALLAWLPPIVQELTGREGNLSALVHFFTRPGNPHPLSDGLTHTGLQLTLMLRSVFAPVSLRVDYAHEGLTAALVVTVAAFVAAVVLARRAGAKDTLRLLGLVALLMPVSVYAVSRIQGTIQFYLVQWVSAVGFVLWVAVGKAAVDAWRVRAARPASPAVRARRRTFGRVVAVVAVVVLCAGAVRAFPSDAGAINEDLDVPNNRELFGYVPAAQLLAATHAGDEVVLRNDSVTAWEVIAADALLLRQHGRDVHIVTTPETRLLFDDTILVSDADGVPAARRVVLSYRDRPQRRFTDGTFLADQGEWTIVVLDPR